ncbi:hypothetical protein TNCV_4321561 [Trichonephila clavipes]|uniref:Uncharacterized protein n=1 Tax=Trichonephila clavipes TaxID=2585209 RepID=A0A8X6SHV9_TRICX|nr:hypothetical protein TNCV_4321561 [Trichonephila clavipes]
MYLSCDGSIRVSSSKHLEKSLGYQLALFTTNPSEEETICTQEKGEDLWQSIYLRMCVYLLTNRMVQKLAKGFKRSRMIRQQYGRWNWRNDPSQHPDTITGSRYNVYSPQLPSPSYDHPSFSLQRPTMYPRNQRLPQRPEVLRPDAPTFYPHQRTRENNAVFEPHRT